MSYLLNTTQHDFDSLHEQADSKRVVKVSSEVLLRLLIDHSALIAYCQHHGLKVTEPTPQRRRIPLR